ncbi:MAG: GNAT family protein [Acidobacteriota bacterium]|nr:GNAT family protein [Acidobacteriota bacterium]
MRDRLFRIYKKRPSEISPVTNFMDKSFEYEMWWPSFFKVFPDRFFRAKLIIWYIFYVLRIFKSNYYGIYLVRYNKKIIHHTFIFPAFFRFPFMGKNDLQIGDVWTDPSFRGRGIASLAIMSVLSRFSKEGKIFWYVVEDTNKSSIKVVEKLGFQLVGYGKKFSRWGSFLLGFYDFVKTNGYEPKKTV